MNALPCRPAIVTAHFGNVAISDAVDNPHVAVMDAWDAGATHIRVDYLDDACPVTGCQREAGHDGTHSFQGVPA